ncbi:serine/threonine protein kinase [Myxococcus sp. CA056]|uniref:serine/threonine protein kinase n=1 Tax=Myxococcus sp. CA056 TaxID=2741740 RepID=UPI00157A5F23|nr:serine/threonine-protein kinase [Myxococcus sp. CA056]NTX13937.1 serine/threonine protein kinase [Myxococcus sp. CA056]
MSATYRLTGRIESGELAELYEAVQAPSGEVVVKLFHPKTSDPAYALDLAETTRLLQSVRHPGILHVVDMGVVRQRLAVVRQDVDGALLGTALQRLHTKEVLLPSAVALYIVIQLLDAVQHAHDAGVIHGALTPGNVVLGRAGTPAVCDFGAMRALLAVPQLRKSFAGRGRGTYRAPEVTRGEAATEASDVYSLGAIAYELLTQREPVIPGSGGVSTRRSEGLPPPSRLDRRINARLDPLVLRALEPTAARRFRSCAEFSNALRNFLSASGGMPGADDVRRFVTELFPNEVSIASLTAPPFKEPFSLEPISGAEMDDLGAEEPEASIVQRAPYTRALSETEARAETLESVPGFEEYRPEDYEPDIAAAPAPSAPEPEQRLPDGDWTEGTQAPGIEQGWDAPPGAAPPKPRRQLGAKGGGADQGAARAQVRNPRMRVFEDFSSPSPPPDDDEEFSVVGRRAAARAKRAPPPVEKGPRTLPDPFPAVAHPGRRDDIAMPPPSAPALPAQPSPRMNTDERSIRDTQHRRGRLVAIAGVLALVGLSTFVIAAWRLGGDGPPVQEPGDAPVLPPDPTPIPRPAPPPKAAAVRAPEPREEVEEQVVALAKPPVRVRGFLSIETNIPAKVFLDGDLISRSTPVRRYPVRVGSYEVMMIALSTGEMKKMSVRILKGKENQVTVLNFSVPPRR